MDGRRATTCFLSATLSVKHDRVATVDHGLWRGKKLRQGRFDLGASVSAAGSHFEIRTVAVIRQDLAGRDADAPARLRLRNKSRRQSDGEGLRGPQSPLCVAQSTSISCPVEILTSRRTRLELRHRHFSRQSSRLTHKRIQRQSTV